jgi:hypothetical protein
MHGIGSKHIGSITVRLCARIAIILPEHAPPHEPGFGFEWGAGVVDCNINVAIPGHP